ncbi:cobyric acid synthase [Nordella sp. HKS 07]|uniref:cobyric acid synthase n=1 Tax=Nordella sp. HKS 07 TaxID=2712222 RepID=UPI0013E130C9|nr:cobyric acid synthase [Nordella sp. HKS 07]QIG52689.1 cobyric acid synthase [Nordella sp. HKS 07]
MLMGTGSDVGKSLIVAGLCRLFTDRGMAVRPFKPQNMSNNAAVTVDGGEIGRAQALQARAARIDPTVHMNPILLKPETTTGAQVIVQGKRSATATARAFFRSRDQYMPAILDSFRRLAGEGDLVIVEGAGSPAEVNLRKGDLANMGFAEAADIPVILIGDIHRGGVIASLVGTQTILSNDDAKRIKGFLINNFHGDPELFSEGVSFTEQRTGWPCLGIVPHFAEARLLPAEDAVALEKAAAIGGGQFHIVVPRLRRIANFDDLDPLKLEPGVTLEIVQPGRPLPRNADLVIVPGSKSTMGDLAALRAQGWDIDMAAHCRQGGAVIGLCGGYQMLGRMIHDPQGLEGQPGSSPGLGLLDVETTLLPDKTLTRVEARHAASGLAVAGYEIHLGSTQGPDCARPFTHIGDQPDGARSADGRVMGTYIHGLFSSDEFRRHFLASLGAEAGTFAFEKVVDDTLDKLADHLARHLDIERLLGLAAPVKL